MRSRERDVCCATKVDKINKFYMAWHGAAAAASTLYARLLATCSHPSISPLSSSIIMIITIFSKIYKHRMELLKKWDPADEINMGQARNKWIEEDNKNVCH